LKRRNILNIRKKFPGKSGNYPEKQAMRAEAAGMGRQKEPHSSCFLIALLSVKRDL